MCRPVEFQTGARLGDVFRNLTRVLGNSDIDDPSAVSTQALLQHYTPFGLRDVGRRGWLKIFRWYD
jgi:hypothetical protein